MVRLTRWPSCMARLSVSLQLARFEPKLGVVQDPDGSLHLMRIQF